MTPGGAARATARLLRSSRLASRGYTLIEVMMALAVLAVGASGIIALQKVTLLGVTMGRNVNAAAAVAAAHVEAVRSDAIQWNNEADYGNSTVLTELLAGSDTTPNNNDWVLAVNSDLGMSDVTGTTSGALVDPPVAYCTHMRLTPLEFDPNPALTTDPPPASEAILMRLEVRTFWAKSGRDLSAECTTPAGVTEIDTGLAGGDMTFGSITRTADDYGWVFLTTAIRRNDIIVNN